MSTTLQLELVAHSQPDVLLRIVGICQRRRCLIVSLRYEDSPQRPRGRVILVVDGQPRQLRQLDRWLENLVEVTAVRRFH